MYRLSYLQTLMLLLQILRCNAAINYHVNPQDAVTLYVHLGPGYADKVISPAVQETIKQVVAHYSAAELITKRPLVKNEATNLITTRLGLPVVVALQ